jgi:hypothetical protein
VDAFDSKESNVNQALTADTAVPAAPVCFNAGPFKGFEGIIVERRNSGRYLIQLHEGVCVEANLVEFSPTVASDVAS